MPMVLDCWSRPRGKIPNDGSHLNSFNLGWLVGWLLSKTVEENPLPRFGAGSSMIQAVKLAGHK